MNTIILLVLLAAIFLILAAINANRIFLYLVTALLLVTPIANTSFMPREVLGITGLNISNIVWLAAFGVAMLVAATHKGGARLSAYFSAPLIVFVFLYFLAAVWTFFDLASIKSPFHQLTRTSVLIEDMLKPFQILLSGWVVFIFCRREGSTLALQRVLYFVPIIISPMAIYFFVFGEGAGSGYREGRDAISSSMGYHANELGALGTFLLAFLLLLKDDAWSLIRFMSIGAALLIIAISFSRMAYVTTVVLLALTFFHLKYKERIVLAVTAGIILVVLSAQLLSRIYYGVDESTGGVDVDTVSAGRIEGIWVPLLPQFISSPIFGSGIYSILKAPAAKSGLPNHPHNAYYQVGLDMGIVGLAALAWLLIRIWRLGQAPPQSLKYVALCWMLMGLTGFSFYPMYSNFIVWIVYGMAASSLGVDRRRLESAISNVSPAKGTPRILAPKGKPRWQSQ